MIKDNQQHFNRLQVVMDAVVVIVSYAFAWWLKFSSGFVWYPAVNMVRISANFP